MRYAKKREDDSMEWQLDDERVRERLVRVRQRKGPMSSRVTRKMGKVDAELLARTARREDRRHSVLPTSPPPASSRHGARAVVPPPLPIPFPFPFANTASTSMPSIAFSSYAPSTAVSRAPAKDFLDEDSAFLNVRDSWLTPAMPSMTPPQAYTAQPGAGVYRTLYPCEPEPFTVVPPAFSLPPRR